MNKDESRVSATQQQLGGDPEVYVVAQRKITLRLIPFLVLCYFVSYLDRVNLGFAALTFKADLAISDASFGLGAGIFFIGYFLFEIPSNLLLERFGARKWIARIMFTWGLASAAMALVSGPTSFYSIRFLLGLAEAGFFPGVILYLTYWFPAADRARVVGLFMIAAPLSSALGAPISSLILNGMKDVGTLASWQWLFILEAAPAILLAIVVLFYLDDQPGSAKWLSAEEKAEVIGRLQSERASREALQKFTLGQALTSPRVMGLSLIYFGVVTGLYGVSFWAPQSVQNFGLSITQTGWTAGLVFLIGAACMPFWAHHSDKTGERVWHIAAPAFLGGIGLILGAWAGKGSPIVALVALTAGYIGICCALPTFWTLPTALLTGTAAAGGIAMVNSIGNLGGFAGPYLVGWIKEGAHSDFLPWCAIGGMMILAGLLTIVMGHESQWESGGRPPYA